MKTAPVKLTFEESGWLCHLLMAEIGPYVLEQVSPKSSGEAAVLARKIALYNKLADANKRTN